MGFLQKNKNPMPVLRLTTHLEKVNNNPSNYYIPNKKNHNNKESTLIIPSVMG